MPARLFASLAALVIVLQLFTSHAAAQGMRADYERANNLLNQLRGKTTMTRLQPFWIDGGTEGLWYQKMLDDGRRQWISVDTTTGEQSNAFDHAKLRSALAEQLGEPERDRLPVLEKLDIASDGESFTFRAFDKNWRYHLADDQLTEAEPETDDREAGDRPSQRNNPRRSPDGRWIAQIVEHNVVLKPVSESDNASEEEPISLTTDGTRDHAYTDRFFWSPDASRLVVIKRKAGDTRRVTIIDTAPDNQLQPNTRQFSYLKPGDQVPIDRPALFDIASMQAIELSHELAPNPYRNTSFRWRADSSAFTYEYNQRGHQAYRVIEIDAKTGATRAIIREEPETFFTYSSKKFIQHLDRTGELIWMSERDGWNHLYLIDQATGDVKNQITQGEWVVRSVQRVDEDSRTVWFWAGGIHAGQDPYHLHFCKADLDTGEVTPLTASDGHHTDLSVSPDGKYLVTTWSRIDHAPVHELRNAETGEPISELARSDDSKLVAAGWVRPERFVAKGRDGETDIHGIILKPTNFDPNKSYPVIENIYAGPHGQHVPKRFYEVMRTQQLAELGFIVVRIDGMGTNWRSKAFHDVAWKNIKDAGFPDRIAWMQAAAETRPWMDLSQVGIYGGSAGGQNAMRAVLDHYDFYKAAVADCGCHDNRMDKIWWNEQWMGYPVDQSYIDSSNTVDAHKLGGALLLTVGELDTNVDPASTMQVVDELIKHNKAFELMVFPGGGHGIGSSAYGKRLMYDFFVRHLHGVEPRRE